MRWYDLFCLVNIMAETKFWLIGCRDSGPSLNQNELSPRYGLQRNGGNETRGKMEVGNIGMGREKTESEREDGNNHIVKLGRSEEKECVGNKPDIVKNGGRERSGMKVKTEFAAGKGDVRVGINSYGYCYHTPSHFKYNDDDITPSVLLDGLVENTTVHGLPNYYQARGT